MQLGLDETEATEFGQAVSEFFARMSQDAWYLDMQITEAQNRRQAMVPTITAAQAVAAKLGMEWPNPAPLPTDPVVPPVVPPTETTEEVVPPPDDTPPATP